MANRSQQQTPTILELLLNAKQEDNTSATQAFHLACFSYLKGKIETLAKEKYADTVKQQVELVCEKIARIKLQQFPVRSEAALKKYLNAIVENHYNSKMVELLEKAIKANTEATKNAFYNVLFESLFTKVQLVVASYYPNEAEDIAADVFAKILRKNISVFPVISDYHLERYIMKIAANHCNTQYRLRKNKPTALDIAEIGEGQFTKNHTEKLDIIMDLNYVIAYLPKQQQLAIRFWSEGYSYKEIAQLMDNTVAGVRNIIWRAKNNLTELLQTEAQQSAKRA